MGEVAEVDNVIPTTCRPSSGRASTKGPFLGDWLSMTGRPFSLGFDLLSDVALPLARSRRRALRGLGLWLQCGLLVRYPFWRLVRLFVYLARYTQLVACSICPDSSSLTRFTRGEASHRCFRWLAAIALIVITPGFRLQSPDPQGIVMAGGLLG